MPAKRNLMTESGASVFTDVRPVALTTCCQAEQMHEAEALSMSKSAEAAM